MNNYTFVYVERPSYTVRTLVLEVVTIETTNQIQELTTAVEKTNKHYDTPIPSLYVIIQMLFFISFIRSRVLQFPFLAVRRAFFDFVAPYNYLSM